MLVEPRELRLCQPKTVLVSAAFHAGQLPQGQINLQTRLDNIVAYRLKSLSTTLVAAVDYNPYVQGTLFVLRSSRLASNRNHNLFVSALPDSPSTTVGTDDSNIIGYLDPRTITTPGFGPPQAMLVSKGHLQLLSRSLAIEQFDWSINLLNDSLVAPASDYTVDFAIEFYSECQCQVRVKDPFGSS